METSEQVLTTDVLVIGAGIAGCFAAIRAKELGVDVLMVEQGVSGYCGMSARGMHMLRVHLPGEDDDDIAMKATVLDCEYMVDQDFAEAIMHDMYPRFQDLLKFGINFRRDDAGQIVWYFEDTFYPPFKDRCVTWEPMSHYIHMLKIKKEAVKRGVKVLDKVLVTDLLTSDGKVQGAVGFHVIDGNFFQFKAKAVVIANGNFVGPGHTYPELTGDGIAMALRAGAELRCMEFGQTQMGMRRPGGGPTLLQLPMNPQPDYRVYNAKDENFLEKYELTKKVSGRKYVGPAWRTQGRAMLQELKEGRGPCWIDFRLPDLHKQLREFRGSSFDRILKQIELTGVTLDKVVAEMIIGIINDQGGGIRINPDCETTLPGLCAAGVASDMGCAPSHTLLCGQIGGAATGHRAGESAAKYALAQSKSGSVDAGKVSQLKSKIYKPLKRKQGVTPDEIRMNIVESWVNIDVRDETRLKKAQEVLKEIEIEASKLFVDDFHELVKAHKTRNILECSQAVADAALVRRETRLSHIRQDYPLTDNKDWLKWVITRRIGEKIQIDLEDIPFQRWKYRPEPTLVDPLEPSKKEASS